MNTFRTALIAAAVSVAGLAAFPAAADDRDDGNRKDWQRASRAMDIDAAARHAQSGGIRHVEEIEMDDGHWEVEGRDARGRELELKLHPHSGKVLSRDYDDDRDRDDRWDD